MNETCLEHEYDDKANMSIRIELLQDKTKKKKDEINDAAIKTSMVMQKREE